MNVQLLVGLALACSVYAPAQLMAPNAAGVSMGHIHLTVRDIDANESFFRLLGGTPVSKGAGRIWGMESCGSPAGATLPEVLKTSAEFRAAESDDGIGAVDSPVHARPFEASADHHFAPSLEDAGGGT
jgi:hypothetical protein